MPRIAVRVTPRGVRDAIDGYGDDGVLRLRIAAAPADGKANDAVIRLLAKALGVPASRVSVASGASSRVKLIDVAGITSESLKAKLSALTNP